MELKQDRMTHRERMHALYSYQKPDRVPIFGMATTFALLNAGYPLTGLQTNPQKAFNALQWTCEQYGWETERQVTAHTVLGSWDFGATMKISGSASLMAIAVETPAVKTEEDVWNLRMPDPKTAGAIPKRMEYSKLQERAGMPITFFTRSPFNTAAEICGVEQFGRWMLEKPEVCDRLLRMSIDHILGVLQYWIDTFGPEKIFYFMSSPDESNQFISSEHFRKYALPYHQEFHKRIRAMGVNQFMFHICGEQNLNLPYLAKFASSADGWPHPSILSFGHEVDLNDAAKYFPDDIIMGNIELAVIETGTHQQVYELCRMTIEKGKKIRGGFILAPGCVIPTKVPAYNVWMMTKAVNDFGWYD